MRRSAPSSAPAHERALVRRPRRRGAPRCSTWAAEQMSPSVEVLAGRLPHLDRGASGPRGACRACATAHRPNSFGSDAADVARGHGRSCAVARLREPARNRPAGFLDELTAPFATDPGRRRHRRAALRRRSRSDGSALASVGGPAALSGGATRRALAPACCSPSSPFAPWMARNRPSRIPATAAHRSWTRQVDASEQPLLSPLPWQPVPGGATAGNGSGRY